MGRRRRFRQLRPTGPDFSSGGKPKKPLCVHLADPSKAKAQGGGMARRMPARASQRASMTTRSTRRPRWSGNDAVKLAWPLIDRLANAGASHRWGAGIVESEKQCPRQRGGCVTGPGPPAHPDDRITPSSGSAWLLRLRGWISPPYFSRIPAAAGWLVGDRRRTCVLVLRLRWFPEPGCA